MSFVDFEELKRRVSIEQCVQMLGLTMKKNGVNLRSACPVCKGGDRTLAVNTTGKFYCFANQKGGDAIGLVAHCLGIHNKEAADKIAAYFKVETAPTNSPTPGPPKAGCPELDYLDCLHEDVEAVGLPVSVADLIGAGHASKGTQRGRVLIPLRTKEGELLGYLGIGLDKTPVYFFPENLTERANVVQLRMK